MGNITQIINKIKTSIFGKDVRESICDGLEQCYNDAIANGHTDMEVAKARGSYSDLNSRLEAEKSEEKQERKQADSNLQNQINGLASGSPLVASSINEMLDRSKIYVNTSNGHWYYYDNDWKDGGVYQASEDSNTVHFLSEKIKMTNNGNQVLNLDFKVGGINLSYGSNSDVTNQIKTSDYIFGYDKDYLSIRALNNKAQFAIVPYDSNNNFLHDEVISWTTDYLYTFEDSKHIKILIRDSSYIDINKEYSKNVEIMYISKNKLELEQLENTINGEYCDNFIWAIGSINASNGTKANSSTRLRTISYLPSNVSYIRSSSDYKIALLAYDNLDNYIGAFDLTDFNEKSLNFQYEFDLSYIFSKFTSYKLKAVIEKTDKSEISLDAWKCISFGINKHITQNEFIDFKNYITDDFFDFDNMVTSNSIESFVDENIIKQEYLGGYIEVQPDSWDGSATSTDDTTKTWGFPTALLPSTQRIIKNKILNGNGTNIMYIRFPLGFAYRGYRNIDESKQLAKNIGERFSGQNSRLKEWFSDISESGGGLAPEYWCPAPFWVTSGSYHGTNYISAGGSYSQSTRLSSIKDTDNTQYNQQIDDFTNAIIDDLVYLHQNIAPVRMFSLQNEPSYDREPYGGCGYDAQTYNDILEVLYPKLKNNPILSKYNDEPNEIKLLVASSDENEPFEGIAKIFIDKHSDWIWGYTHHSMRKASGEVKSKNGAEWYKSEEFKNLKGNKTNVFINEYEFFNRSSTINFYRSSNNMLHLINEIIYGEAKVLHPVIHICKPIGQNLYSTNTERLLFICLQSSWRVWIGTDRY